MSHFKYEINERNLRLQIKENKVPFNEEAWLKFESYSAMQKNHHHENVMNRFNLSLNRNLVLPLVFGGVIALFSLLLFNFVNIKNPNQETAEAKSEPEVAAPVIEQKKANLPTPSQKESAPVKIKDSVMIAPQQEIKLEVPETSNVIAAREKPVIRIQKSSEVVDTGNIKPELNSEAIKTESILTVTPANAIEAPKKKKKHKRQLIVTEPTVDEETQVPPPVSQTSSSSEEIQ